MIVRSRGSILENCWSSCALERLDSSFSWFISSIGNAEFLTSETTPSLDKNDKRRGASNVLGSKVQLTNLESAAQVVPPNSCGAVTCGSDVSNQSSTVLQGTNLSQRVLLDSWPPLYSPPAFDELSARPINACLISWVTWASSGASDITHVSSSPAIVSRQTGHVFSNVFLHTLQIRYGCHINNIQIYSPLTIYYMSSRNLLRISQNNNWFKDECEEISTDSTTFKTA